MKVVKLENIAKVSAGQGAPQGDHSYGDNGQPFIKAGSLEDLIITNDEYKSCKLVSKETAKKYKLKSYPKDTLVFAKSGMSATKDRIYALKNESYVVNHLATIIPNHKLVETSYLKYFLYIFPPSRLIKDESYPSIGLADINKIEIPLPPLEDQKQIVKILDKADSLRQKRKQAVGLLDDYLKSVFLEMFGDPVKNPKGWKIEKLGEIIDFMTSGSRGWAKYYSKSGAIFLRIQNVGKNQLMIDELCYVSVPSTAEAKRTEVRSGDVLLSITADLGRTAVIPKNFKQAFISQHLALLRLKKEYNPEYVSEFLASEGGNIQIKKLDKGGTKAGLNFDDVKSVKIMFPSDKMQKNYIHIKNEVEILKQIMLTQSKELEIQFQALMQKAFKS